MPPSATPESGTRVAGPGTLVRVTETPRRVVIAEDEALIRLDLKEMLEEDGYDVVGEAGDGETAVRLADGAPPDLVILDVKMPMLDGISAAERIAAERIAPVVILTAFSQRELVERARDAGRHGVPRQAVHKADLVPAIEMAVSRFQEIKSLEAEVGTPRGAAGDPQGGRAGQGRCCRPRTAGRSRRRSAGSRRPRWTAG